METLKEEVNKRVEDMEVKRRVYNLNLSMEQVIGEY